MQFKLLTLAICTAMSLTACGGSGTSGSEITKDNNPNENTIIKTPTDNQVDDKSNKVTEWTDFVFLYSGRSIVKKESTYNITADGKAYKNVNIPKSLYDQHLYVTEDGDYAEEGPKGTLGNYIGQISIQNSTWMHKPYSANNSSGLELTTEFKEIDLTGKSLYSVLEPQDDWTLNNNLESQFPIGSNESYYFNALKETKFPLGSICLQKTETRTNQNYLKITNDEESNYIMEYNASARDYELNPKSVNQRKVNYKNTIAYLSPPKEYISSTSGFAQFNNEYYFAYEYLVGVNYNLEEYITSQKEKIPNTWDTLKQENANKRIDSLRNSCTYYNKTAKNIINKTLTN